ncbi:MAG: HEAT repeat domain-containing protein [Vulcanimicrobiota bacterium]
MTGQLVHGGQSELIWARLLHHDLLHIRLCALRALAGMGRAGARALLLGPSFRRQGESYPFIWALSRCIHPDLFDVLQISGAPTHDLLARVRFLTRRAGRPHLWKKVRTRLHCAEAVARSEHPLQTLACTVRLMEMHKDHAIPVLLDLLRAPPAQFLWDEIADCAAWALGQFGRLAVHDLVREYRKVSSARMAAHLATALWYLGPLAEPALPFLLKDSSMEATAALLALEQRGSRAMVEAGRGPVWLDEEAIQSLATIAFSDGDRAYAAAALSCFGPAATSGLPILQHLARDPKPEVRLNVARGLGWGGRPDGLSLLLELGEDANESVRARARSSIQSYYQSEEEMQRVLLELARGDSELLARRAAEQLAECGLPEDEDVRDLLSNPWLAPPILQALCKARQPPDSYRPLVLDLLGAPGPARPLAARLLARWPQDERSRQCWRLLILNPGNDPLEPALDALHHSGLSLREWGFEEAELLTLPTPALGALLAAVRPDRLHWEDVLPLLQRPELEAKRAAALALRVCRPPLERVETQLAACLPSPDINLSLECARTLLALGSPDYRWALLRSGLVFDRELTLEGGRLPEGFREHYVDGLLYSQVNFRLMRAYLPAEEVAEIEVEAIKSRPIQADYRQLASLGVVALDHLPELLGHLSPATRHVARSALESILTLDSSEIRHWLGRHALILPLAEGAPPPELEALQLILCSYLERARLFCDPTFRPLWLQLARSWQASVALRAVEALTSSWLERPEQPLLEGLLHALGHCEESVRQAALLRVGRHFPAAAWRADDSTPEARWLGVARRFAEGELSLPQTELQAALLRLTPWRLTETRFFVPEGPDQLLRLLDLAGTNSECDATLVRLIRAYRGQTGRSVWQRIQEICLIPSLAGLHGPLAQRWPRLVLKALRSRSDALEWLGRLGDHGREGLGRALKHSQPVYRLLALQVLAGGQSDLAFHQTRLSELAQHDPDARVRAAAAALLSDGG